MNESAEIRQAILNYLQMLTVVGELKHTTTASSWLQSYPDLYQSNGKLDLTFSFEGNSYIFRIHANIVTEELFFDIIDYSDNYLQIFQKIVEYPNNLLICNTFIGCSIYFYENKIYLDTGD